MSSLNPNSRYKTSSDSEAVFEEGLTYLQQKNYVKAAQLFQQGVERNHSKSCYELGFLYYFGTGVLSNPDKARALWQRAADQEYFGAQVLLAHFKHIEKEKRRYEQKNC